MKTQQFINKYQGSNNANLKVNTYDYRKDMFSDFPDMLTVPQVMRALNISQYATRALIHSGELRSRLVKGSYRVPKSSLFEYTYGSGKAADEQPTMYLLRRVC